MKEIYGILCPCAHVRLRGWSGDGRLYQVDIKNPNGIMDRLSAVKENQTITIHYGAMPTVIRGAGPMRAATITVSSIVTDGSGPKRICRLKGMERDRGRRVQVTVYFQYRSVILQIL